MPLGVLQVWAMMGLEALTDADHDRARVRNHAGFSKLDGDFGRSLHSQFVKRGRLSLKQWTAALKLAWKYRGQIGAPPLDFTFPNV